MVSPLPLYPVTVSPPASRAPRRVCRDDLAVRAATLAGLTHTTSPQQFSELQGALQGGDWGGCVMCVYLLLFGKQRNAKK